MKVAVVGSGVSGLAATWLLNEYSEHEVHLFDADDRPGGHANTVEFKDPSKPNAKPVNVDRGFIVFNIPTYPNFSRFLHINNIPWLKTEMTFSVTRDRGAFEWAGKNPLTLFCQPSNLFRPEMWRMVWDVLRFNARATVAVSTVPGSQNDIIGEKSFGEWLGEQQYSDAFIDNYILPMTACIWSTPPNICALDFPARSQLRFMYNHHLLQLVAKPPWLTVSGGSKHYVDRIVSKLPPEQLHLSTPIASVTTAYPSRTSSPSLDSKSTNSSSSTLVSPPSVILTTESGQQLEFDHVILACHSDTSLKMLKMGEGGATDMEKKVLSAFGWAHNEVVVHNDVEVVYQLMPLRKMAWSCWNFITSSQVSKGRKVNSNPDNQVSLTCKLNIYDMNQLQHISETDHGKVLVTLNPPYGPRPETIVSRQSFSHPMFTPQSPWAQANLHQIQNVRGVTFAGAWTKHGFHEDGFTSGMTVACEYLGARPPFTIMSPDRKPISHDQEKWLQTYEMLEAWRVWLCTLLVAVYVVVIGL
ncbi:hypothetical protein FRB99_005366 [Tulasnella sp. 403]|nr:hypothetical protein FRB99_005366 [Tulasnella sp. 403]